MSSNAHTSGRRLSGPLKKVLKQQFQEVLRCLYVFLIATFPFRVQNIVFLSSRRLEEGRTSLVNMMKGFRKCLSWVIPSTSRAYHDPVTPCQLSDGVGKAVRRWVVERRPLTPPFRNKKCGETIRRQNEEEKVFLGWVRCDGRINYRALSDSREHLYHESKRALFFLI